MAVQLTPQHGRWSFPAGSAGLQQYQFVAINSSGQIVTPTSTGVFAVVLDDAPSLAVSTVGTGGVVTGGYTVGQNYGCVFDGIMKVISGATLSPGAAIQTDTSGHAVSAVTGGVILGWTLAASSSGDIISVLLDRSKF